MVLLSHKWTHKETGPTEAITKHVALICAVAAAFLAVTEGHAELLYPNVINISDATPQTATFFKSYFTATSEHKPAATTDHFSEVHLTYIDATLGR